MRCVEMGSRVVLAAALLLPVASFAQTKDMNVSIQVNEICVFEHTDYYLSFGTYGPEHDTAPLDAQVDIGVRCVGGMRAWVLLYPGANMAPGSTQAAPLRRMRNSRGSYLRYDLYQDAARTVPWGGDTSTALSIIGLQGVYEPVPVFGRIPAGQAGTSGDYSDYVLINYVM